MFKQKVVLILEWQENLITLKYFLKALLGFKHLLTHKQIHSRLLVLESITFSLQEDIAEQRGTSADVLQPSGISAGQEGQKIPSPASCVTNYAGCREKIGLNPQHINHIAPLNLFSGAWKKNKLSLQNLYIHTYTALPTKMLAVQLYFFNHFMILLPVADSRHNLFR